MSSHGCETASRLRSRFLYGLVIAVALAASACSTDTPCTGDPSTEPFAVVGDQNDIDELWSALPGAGYLAFISYPDGTAPGPIEALCGTIPLEPAELGTEEDTGWSNPDGEGHSDYVLGLQLVQPVDNHDWAGNRADFDWVRENREWEVVHRGLHPADTGLLTFEILDDPPYPPHTSGNVTHDHGTLGEVNLSEFGDVFNRVDVMSITLLRSAGNLDVETDEGLPGEPVERAAALDYDLWFIDLQSKTSTHGVPEVVFVPGWNPDTFVDDYVARWSPATDGSWDAVAIEPHRDEGRDGTVEIDAVVAALVP